MKKNIIVCLFALASASAFAFEQAPAPILEGGPISLDQVGLVESFTPATGNSIATHSVQVVVSGLFQSMCGGLDGIVRTSRQDERTGTRIYQASGVYAPIRCMAIGRMVRKTFVLDTIFLAPNEQVPSVVVNGIRGIRTSSR